MYLIGIALYLIGFLSAMYLKGVALTALIVPSAIILQLFALIAVLTGTQGFEAFAHGLRAAAFPRKTITEDMRGKAASLFRLLSKTTALAAALGALLGCVEMLSGLNDPEAMGHGLAAALVSPLLGVLLIAAVFEPAVVILKKRHGKEHLPE
jgi:flagellar motor component MotA